MVINSITEAKAQLSELIERAQAGEEIIISRAGKPVAVLIAFSRYPKRRQPGALEGEIKIAADFDSLTSDLKAASVMDES